MELLVVIVVLGGLWAALLLPSFLDSRHDAPLTSTKTFDRRIAKLASLRPEAIEPRQLARQRVIAKRRRVMMSLLGAAIVTLVGAIWVGSIPLLLVSLAFDGLFLVYLLALNQLEHRAKVLPRIPQEPIRYGELRLVQDDDFPEAASR